MTIALFGNAQKAHIREEVEHILEFMQKREVSVVLSQELRQELNLREYKPFPEDEVTEMEETIDFVLSIGGDGTFLTSAAMVGRRNIPILGINFGHLGFLAEVETKHVDAIMDQLIQGQYTIEQRNILAVTSTEGGNLVRPYALNEVAVLKYGLSSMLSVEVKVNGELLNTYDADGMIIATPTGSTAYNMSIGGPLMVPQCKGIILSPIASHSLTVRPIVIPDDWQIDLTLKARNGAYMVSFDGRSQVVGDQVKLHVEKADYTIKLVQIGENSFIQSLKNKLLWGAN